MGKDKKGAGWNSGKWRDFLDKFHVYGGLFIAGYLIILGLSSLQYQHHFNLPKNGAKKNWEQRIHMPAIKDKTEFKTAVMDSLGLFGHTPWWQDYKDDNGVHHFMITRPGKSYWVEVPKSSNVFKVEETGSGFLNMVLALHGLTGGALQGPAFIKIWKYIAQIMNVVFLIVLILTVYFWFERSLRTTKGWVFAGTFAFVSIVTLIFIWLVG